MALSTIGTNQLDTTDNINFGDNDKAQFGAGNDLQIYHDASHSYVSDAGTGNLQLSTNGTAIKMLRGNGEVLGSFNIGGSVDLYHSNAKKVETTASGINVTGNIDFSGGILASNGSVQFVMDKDNNGGEVFLWGHNASDATTNELMRLTSAGRLLVNTTNASPSNISSGTVGGCSFGEDNGGEIASDAYNTFQINKLNSTSGGLIAFRYNATQVGYIGTNGTTTTYNTSSDYRLKENVTDITGATDRLKQLNPVRFNFIADADTTVDGFLAHEVQDIVPEAITGTKDAVDDDGNAVMQGIDQSKLVPLLVATIQEQQAAIEALTARVTSLEAN